MKKLLNNPLFLCYSLYFLGLADCIMTIIGISTHKGYEANPIMAWVLGFGYGAFICSKMIVTGIACLLMYRYIDKIYWARAMLKGIIIFYAVVVLYQIVGIWIV